MKCYLKFRSHDNTRNIAEARFSCTERKIYRVSVAVFRVEAYISVRIQI